MSHRRVRPAFTKPADEPATTRPVDSRRTLPTPRTTRLAGRGATRRGGTSPDPDNAPPRRSRARLYTETYTYTARHNPAPPRATPRRSTDPHAAHRPAVARWTRYLPPPLAVAIVPLLPPGQCAIATPCRPLLERSRVPGKTPTPVPRPPPHGDATAYPRDRRPPRHHAAVSCRSHYRPRTRDDDGEDPRGRRGHGLPRVGRGTVYSRAPRRPGGPRTPPPPRTTAPYHPSIRVWLHVWILRSTPIATPREAAGDRDARTGSGRGDRRGQPTAPRLAGTARHGRGQRHRAGDLGVRPRRRRVGRSEPHRAPPPAHDAALGRHRPGNGRRVTGMPPTGDTAVCPSRRSTPREWTAPHHRTARQAKFFLGGTPTVWRGGVRCLERHSAASPRWRSCTRSPNDRDGGGMASGAESGATAAAPSRSSRRPRIRRLWIPPYRCSGRGATGRLTSDAVTSQARVIASTVPVSKPSPPAHARVSTPARAHAGAPTRRTRRRSRSCGAGRAPLVAGLTLPNDAPSPAPIARPRGTGCPTHGTSGTYYPATRTPPATPVLRGGPSAGPAASGGDVPLEGVRPAGRKMGTVRGSRVVHEAGWSHACGPTGREGTREHGVVPPVVDHDGIASSRARSCRAGDPPIENLRLPLPCEYGRGRRSTAPPQQSMRKLTVYGTLAAWIGRCACASNPPSHRPLCWRRRRASSRRSSTRSRRMATRRAKKTRLANSPCGW